MEDVLRKRATQISHPSSSSDFSWNSRRFKELPADLCRLLLTCRAAAVILTESSGKYPFVLELKKYQGGFDHVSFEPKTG